MVVETGALAMNATAGAALSRQADCDAPSVAARVSAVDALHWLSSALTSLSRGLNDTPKIVALGIAGSALLKISGFPFYAAVAIGMGAGSLMSGFRVTETLARRVTPMSHGEGFAANLATSVLVGLASFAALPVSTTHVSSGAIIGIGLHRGADTVRWRTVADMLLAWLVTLPLSAALGAVACALLRTR